MGPSRGRWDVCGRVARLRRLRLAQACLPKGREHLEGALRGFAAHGPGFKEQTGIEAFNGDAAVGQRLLQCLVAQCDSRLIAPIPCDSFGARFGNKLLQGRKSGAVPQDQTGTE